MSRRLYIFLTIVLVMAGFIFWLLSNHSPSVNTSAALGTTKKNINSEPIEGKHHDTIESSNVSEKSVSSSSNKLNQETLFRNIAPLYQNDNLEKELRGRQIISKLRHNFDNLKRISYQIRWESLNNDDGDSDFLAEAKFKRPFYYSEKGVEGRIYSYFSEGVFEQYVYDRQSYGFVGESETPILDTVNDGDGLLDRFPLRILQTQGMKLLGEETIRDSNEGHTVCEVVGNEYWKIYVAKDSDAVIRADYYRNRGTINDTLLSLSDFEYSKVEVGETKDGEKLFMNFPVRFKAVYPDTGWKYKCEVLNIQTNDKTSFDDSIFEYGSELDLIPEL